MAEPDPAGTGNTGVAVLIVGAGPVGLGLALELSSRGIGCGEYKPRRPNLGRHGIHILQHGNRFLIPLQFELQNTE